MAANSLFFSGYRIAFSLEKSMAPGHSFYIIFPCLFYNFSPFHICYCQNCLMGNACFAWSCFRRPGQKPFNSANLLIFSRISGSAAPFIIESISISTPHNLYPGSQNLQPLSDPRPTLCPHSWSLLRSAQRCSKNHCTDKRPVLP